MFQCVRFLLNMNKKLLLVANTFRRWWSSVSKSARDVEAFACYRCVLVQGKTKMLPMHLRVDELSVEVSRTWYGVRVRVKLYLGRESHVECGCILSMTKSQGATMEQSSSCVGVVLGDELLMIYARDASIVVASASTSSKLPSRMYSFYLSSPKMLYYLCFYAQFSTPSMDCSSLGI